MSLKSLKIHGSLPQASLLFSPGWIALKRPNLVADAVVRDYTPKFVPFHPQVGQRKQHDDLRLAVLESKTKRLYGAELALNHTKWVAPHWSEHIP